MKEYQTKRCVVCLKEATIWSGYILEGEEKITAGWCKKHRYYKKPPSPLSCYGGYHSKYEKEEVKENRNENSRR